MSNWQVDYSDLLDIAPLLLTQKNQKSPGFLVSAGAMHDAQ